MGDGLAALAAQNRRGGGASLALVEEHLARIADEDSRLGAFEAVFSEKALAAARSADRAAAEGRDLGPLHGVPLAVKDLAEIAGRAPGFGSRNYGSRTPERTAPFLARLEAAGAISLGVTRLVEFANGSWGTNHALGTPWNPADRDVHRAPGGSSSGSAVAVAAGLVPAAIGSDTGGSIRIPASLCGVVGYKPSYGMIPLDGAAPLGPSLDTIGPLARTVADARLLVEVMTTRHLAAPPPAPQDAPLGAVEPGQLAPLEPAVAGAHDAALGALRAAGFPIVPIRLPLDPATCQALSGDIVAHEIYGHVGHLAEDPAAPLDPHVRRRVLRGREIDAARHAALLAERRARIAAFAAQAAGVAALVLPTTPLTAPPLGEVDEDRIPLSRLTRFVNYFDLCAISLPLPVGGLPVGLQLAAPTGADARLLALAGAVAERLDAARPTVHTD